VRQAYFHPILDSSDEPFKWGMPDLDALRVYFQNELGWGQAKVDEILLPIIQRMNKRGESSAMNKQSNLNEFFDISTGSGTHAPRKRSAYTSKRLQNVVDDFRRKRRRVSKSLEGTESESEEESVLARKHSKMPKPKGKSNKNRFRSSQQKPSHEEEVSDASSSEAYMEDVEIPPDPDVVARLRPRPRAR